MKYLIVVDSSADLANKDFNGSLTKVSSVPLKIITSLKEYVDDGTLNVEVMVNELEDYKGRSSPGRIWLWSHNTCQPP